MRFFSSTSSAAFAGSWKALPVVRGTTRMAMGERSSVSATTFTADDGPSGTWTNW